MATADFIAFHASERPDAAAFLADGRAIAYSAFDRDIDRMAAALAGLGVKRGSLVAVGADDYYLHYLILIAVEAMGAISASFAPSENDSSRDLLTRADLVLAEPQYPIPGARHHRAIAAEWMQNVWALSAPRRPASGAAAAGDTVRITRTSGTTGVMRPMAIPHGKLERRFGRYAMAHQFTEASRYLPTMKPVAFPVYATAMACLRSGGTLVVESARGLTPVQALAAHGITDMTLMPLHLKHVLDALPADFAKPSRLTVYIFGGPISAALRERALAQLATTVYGSYGTNEAGFIAISRSGEGNGGTIWPDVEVEVVDETGAALPAGTVGSIRVRSDFAVEGYLDDPEATRRMFRDGWFYPGDSGTVDGARHLSILGRSDELLNIGGIKWRPEDLEELVARDPAIKDVGICAFKNADGFEEVCVSVVTDRPVDRELMDRILRSLGNQQLGRIGLVGVRAIPRSEAGKIERERLRALVAEARRRNS